MKKLFWELKDSSPIKSIDGFEFQEDDLHLSELWRHDFDKYESSVAYITWTRGGWSPQKFMVAQS